MQIQGKYTFSGGIFPHLSQTFIQYIMNVYQFLSMLVFFSSIFTIRICELFPPPPPCFDVNLRVNNDGKREPIISHRTLCKLYALSVEASFQALLTNDKNSVLWRFKVKFAVQSYNKLLLQLRAIGSI